MTSSREAFEPTIVEGWFGLEPGASDEGFENDPYPLLARARIEAPVHRTPAGFWRLMRYDDVMRLLREVPCGVRMTNGRLPGRAEADGDTPSGGFMLQQDPPTHTRLRKLVSKAFTPRATESWRPRARSVAEGLVASALERGSLDVVSDLALPVPATLICEMLGVPVEDRDRFTAWTGAATFNLAGELAEPEVRARAQAAAGELALYFSSLIEERRGRLGDDLVSQMIRVEEAGDRLSAEELLVQCIGLLIAGFETTIGLIANGVRQLALHPQQFERLRADPALIGSAVEECLRFDGPILLTVRVLHEDAEFGGQLIPKDTEIMAMLGSANRDPERFAQPDVFDVGREDNAHLAFGGGVHRCLGAHLARMEGQEAIGALVRGVSRIELEDDDLDWGHSLFRVPGRLPLRVEPG